jgi:hypothetical protein
MLNFILYFLALGLSCDLSVVDSSNDLWDCHVHYRVDLWCLNSPRSSSPKHRLWPCSLIFRLPIKLSLQLLRVHTVVQVHNRVSPIGCRHAIDVFKDKSHRGLLEPNLRFEIKVHFREDLIHCLVL